MRGCADPRRPHGWIDKKFIAAYTELHRLGWAHSVETWQEMRAATMVLVGGLYGVSIGGLFAAESKFHRVTDASKVAVVALVDLMRAGGGTLARRAVDHAAPGVARRGRRVALPSYLDASSPTADVDADRSRRCAIGSSRAHGEPVACAPMSEA